MRAITIIEAVPIAIIEGRTVECWGTTGGLFSVPFLVQPRQPVRVDGRL